MTAAGPAVRAIPPVVFETHVVLRIDALTVVGGRSTATGVRQQIEIGPAKPQAADLRVPWGDGPAIDVHLQVSLASASPDGSLTLRCESRAGAPGRAPLRASRDLHLSDEGAGIFEVYGDGEQRLLLALQGERVERPAVAAAPTVGAPVRFTVAVEGVAGDRSALLETNEMHTFVGASVEYSFNTGQGEGREAIRLVLLPESIAGDLITIRVEIGGVLPGASGPVLLNRTERIVASRRSTSFVAATAGTPPAGYRFQVTPDF